MASSPSPNSQRVRKDVCKLMENKYPVTLVNGFSEFIVKFYGPKDTPYHGGVWNVRVELPDTYPFKSPSIGFMNRIFHPNIDEPSGSVCLDVINQQWTPLYDMCNVFDTFLPQLLVDPNPSDPLNTEAANLKIHNAARYEQRVKDMVQKYATKEALRQQDEKYEWQNLEEDEDEPAAGGENMLDADGNSDDGNLSEMSDNDIEMDW